MEHKLDLSQFKGHTPDELYVSGEQIITPGNATPTKAVYQIYKRYGGFLHVGTINNADDAKLFAQASGLLTYARKLEGEMEELKAKVSEQRIVIGLSNEAIDSFKGQRDELQATVAELIGALEKLVCNYSTHKPKADVEAARAALDKAKIQGGDSNEESSRYPH